MLEFTLQHPVATAFIGICGFWSIEAVLTRLFDLIEKLAGGSK